MAFVERNQLKIFGDFNNQQIRTRGNILQDVEATGLSFIYGTYNVYEIVDEQKAFMYLINR
jgi:hypothetical protein